MSHGSRPVHWFRDVGNLLCKLVLPLYSEFIENLSLAVVFDFYVPWPGSAWGLSHVTMAMLHVQRGFCTPLSIARRAQCLLEISPESFSDFSKDVSFFRNFASQRSEVRSENISLAVPSFVVWGANTGVGKTLVSAALAHEATAQKVWSRNAAARFPLRSKRCAR